jgi:hypothetical protein
VAHWHLLQTGVPLTVFHHPRMPSSPMEVLFPNGPLLPPGGPLSKLLPSSPPVSRLPRAPSPLYGTASSYLFLTVC